MTKVSQLQYSTVHNLKPNTTYYFQVRAYTKVGAGPYTDLMNVSTTHENPIPQLLIVSHQDIKLWDFDSKIKVNLVEKQSVSHVAYSIAEHKIYWFDFHEEDLNLMTQEMNKPNIIKITHVKDFHKISASNGYQEIYTGRNMTGFIMSS